MVCRCRRLCGWVSPVTGTGGNYRPRARRHAQTRTTFMITTVKGPRPEARVVSNPRGKAHTYTSQWHTSPSYYRHGEENSRIHRAPPAWGRWKFDEYYIVRPPLNHCKCMLQLEAGVFYLRLRLEEFLVAFDPSAVRSPAHLIQWTHVILLQRLVYFFPPVD